MSPNPTKSSYSHGYTYDIFITYSTRDRDWVCQFYDDLVADVNRFTEDVYPFLDKERLQPGYAWNEHLLEAASNSAILVPVLTPRFFDSDYCQKEVSAFLGGQDLVADAAHRTRVIPVQLLRAAPGDHVLAKVQAIEFMNPGEIPFEYEHGSPQYKDRLRKLAYSIAQTLKTVPPKGQRRPIVYVASDFTPAAEKLRASLIHHFEVLPPDPEGLRRLSSQQLEASLTRDFAQCFASVHMLGGAPGDQLLIDAQIAFAEKQNKPRLVWTVNRPDDLTSTGFEWFRSQTEIENHLRYLRSNPTVPRQSGVDPLIYFLCSDRENRLRAENLIVTLESRGVRVYISPLEGSADQALQTHLKALDGLDGCLIYYGDIDREWFDAVFLRVRKKIYQRRLPSAIFVAPPPTEHKHDLQHIGVTLLQDAESAVRAFSGGGP